MILGERLKHLREGKYSQEDIANMLHVHNNTISKWENGTQEPRANRIAELAKILGTTSAYLLGDTDNPSVKFASSTVENNIANIEQQDGNISSNGMLVYEVNGERFEAPPTDMGISYIERMRSAVQSAIAQSAVPV